MGAIHRTGAEKLHGWLVTGPVGHLWSGVADAAVLVVRHGPWRRR